MVLSTLNKQVSNPVSKKLDWGIGLILFFCKKNKIVDQESMGNYKLQTHCAISKLWEYSPKLKVNS